jgi:hypothetical protein
VLCGDALRCCCAAQKCCGYCGGVVRESQDFPALTNQHYELSELQKNENYEADKGKSFGEGDTEEHGGTNHAGGFWLTGHGLNSVTNKVTNANAGSNGAETVSGTSVDGAVCGLLCVCVECLSEDAHGVSLGFVLNVALRLMGVVIAVLLRQETISDGNGACAAVVTQPGTSSEGLLVFWVHGTTDEHGGEKGENVGL